MTTLTIRPNAAGNSTTWVSQYPSSGSHYDKCDEETHDGDTTYVATSSGAQSDEYDLYGLNDHTTESGAVDSVTVYGVARKTSTLGSAGYVKNYLRTNGVNYTGNSISLSTSYASGSTTYVTNPQTGSAWTWSEIDALQAGANGKSFHRYFKEADDWYPVRLTQVYVEVNWTPAGLDIVKIRSETVQTSEGKKTRRALVRRKAETEQTGEGSKRPRRLLRRKTETEQIGDGSWRVRALFRKRTETVNIAEATERLRDLVRSKAESLSIPETQATAKGIVRSFAETGSISEAKAIVRGLVRIVTETEGMQEAFKSARALIRFKAETILIAESKHAIRALVRAFPETFSIIEGKGRSLGLTRAKAESLQVEESSSKTKSISKIINEALGVVEALKRLLRLVSILRKYPPTLTTAEWNAAMDFLGGFTTDPRITMPKILEDGSTRYLFQNKGQNVSITATVVVNLTASEPDTGYIVILQNVGVSQAILRITAKTTTSFSVATDAATAFDWALIR